MADAPDPGGRAAATPPDQGSAMELELSQALIELRRLTLFQGLALGRSLATSPKNSYGSSWLG